MFHVKHFTLFLISCHFEPQAEREGVKIYCLMGGVCSIFFSLALVAIDLDGRKAIKMTLFFYFSHVIPFLRQPFPFPLSLFCASKNQGIFKFF